MNGENGVIVDLAEVRKVIETCDVFTVSFSNLRKRLIVDTRSSEEAKPLVAVVNPVGGVQERYFWLGKYRGALGVPKAFGFFNWPGSPAYLVESGVWDLIRERVSADRDPLVDAACGEAVKRLRQLDRRAVLQAIRGEGYLTVWPRSD